MKRLTICVAVLGIAGCGSGVLKKNTEARNANTDESDASSVKTESELNQAIADYTEAIRLEPTHAVAYYNRGLAHQALGDKAKAEADLAKGRVPGFQD